MIRSRRWLLASAFCALGGLLTWTSSFARRFRTPTHLASLPGTARLLDTTPPGLAPLAPLPETHEALAAAIQSDATQGKFINIGGWLIPETEARLLVLLRPQNPP